MPTNIIETRDIFCMRGKYMKTNLCRLTVPALFLISLSGCATGASKLGETRGARSLADTGTTSASTLLENAKKGDQFSMLNVVSVDMGASKARGTSDISIDVSHSTISFLGQGPEANVTCQLAGAKIEDVGLYQSFWTFGVRSYLGTISDIKVTDNEPQNPSTNTRTVVVTAKSDQGTVTLRCQYYSAGKLMPSPDATTVGGLSELTQGLVTILPPMGKQ